MQTQISMSEHVLACSGVLLFPSGPANSNILPELATEYLVHICVPLCTFVNLVNLVPEGQLGSAWQGTEVLSLVFEQHLIPGNILRSKLRQGP